MWTPIATGRRSRAVFSISRVVMGVPFDFGYSSVSSRASRAAYEVSLIVLTAAEFSSAFVKVDRTVLRISCHRVKSNGLIRARCQHKIPILRFLPSPRWFHYHGIRPRRQDLVRSHGLKTRFQHDISAPCHPGRFHVTPAVHRMSRFTQRVAHAVIWISIF